MKKTALLALIAASLVAVVSTAQATVLYTGSYSENFDSTLNGTSVNSPGPWSSTAGTQAAVPGSSGWDGVKVAGTGASNMNYTVDDGTANSGAIYNYGSSATDVNDVGPTTDRALGVVASGTNIAAFGVELKNTTGATITSVTISYRGEFWRSSTSTQNVLAFAYEVGAAGSTTYLTDAAATADASLNLVGPAFVAANGRLDGNASGNNANFSDTLTNLNWTDGSSLYIRWTDTNDIGNDAGLAVDNFSAVSVPEPATLVLGGLGLLSVAGFAFRRKMA